MAEKKRFKIGLLPQMLIGIVVGCLVGLIGPVFGVQENVAFSTVISLLVTFSDIFTQFLKFVVPLLIISYIGCGLAELGKRANKLFGITVGLSYGFTLMAGAIATVVGLSVLPGLVQPITGEAGGTVAYESLLSNLHFDPVMPVLTSLILAFVIGLGAANLKTDKLYDVLLDVRDIVGLVIGKIIIPVIPFFMVCLFANIAASGELIAALGMFLTLFLFIVAFQWVELVLEYGTASIYTKKNQFPKIKNALPAYITALGTKSSAASIPINMQCAEKNGTDKDIAGFVIPLCANIHLAGDAICLTFEGIGLMLAFGMEPTLGMMLPFIFMLGIMMIAAPGIPGGGAAASLGLFSGILHFNEPMLAMVIALHTTQDSFGTACNVTGDHAISFIVQKFDEAQRNRKAKKAA